MKFEQGIHALGTGLKAYRDEMTCTHLARGFNENFSPL